MEGIARFCKPRELIRIGSKSQSEALQKLNLSNIRKEMRIEREVPYYINQARIKSIFESSLYQRTISELEQKLEDVKEHFVSYELQNVIRNCNPNHLGQLEWHLSWRFKDIGILGWLGCKVKSKNDKNTKSDTNRVANDKLDSSKRIPEQPALVDGHTFDEEDIIEIERNRMIDSLSDDEEDEHDPQHRLDERIDFNNIVLTDLEDIDAEGFTTVKGKKKTSKKQFKSEIAKSHTMSREQAEAIDDINTLSSNQRWDLYRLWVKLYIEDLGEQIKANCRLYREECLRFNDICNHEDVAVAEKAKIIGMTTTGAAKYRHIIAGIKPKITSKKMHFFFERRI